MLGGEQSGHIAGVGFDLYLRMIGEAVSVFRGDVAEGQTELRLEIPVDARIPEDYLDSERLRLEAYQKLSIASSPTAPDGQIDLVLDELTDRYGEPPLPVLTLSRVSRLRRRAHAASLGEVVVIGPNLRLTPVDLPDSVQVRLARMYPGAKYAPAARVVTIPVPDMTSPSAPDLVEWVDGVLTALFPSAAGVGASPTGANGNENATNND